MSLTLEQFLRSVPPFDRLDAVDLRALMGSIETRRFSKGERIHQQGGAPGNYLYIVREGAVRIFLERPGRSEPVVDYVRAGGTFGFPSLIDGKVSTATSEVVEDAICLLLSRDRFRLLLSRNPAVAEHFSRSLAARLKRTTTALAGTESISVDSEDNGPGVSGDISSRRVADLMSRRLITCGPQDDIRTVANTMVGSDIGSIVVVDEEGRVGGILTDTDLRRAVAISYSGPVSGLMSRGVISVEARTFAFEAIYEMLKHDIHHLVVTEDSRPIGLLSTSDLLAAHGESPMYLAREADRAPSIERLGSLHSRMERMVAALISGGSSAYDAGRITAETNDRILQRVIELVEQRLAERGVKKPPIPYCWVSLGSEGRREQTLRTDQDNALIYLDPAANEAGEAEAYFRLFAAEVIGDLITIGFPACKGDVMASNPQWCKPLADWKRYFSNWVRESEPKALLNATIFFDFRSIAGDAFIADSLREHLRREVAANKIFVGRMARAALDQGPPLGIFRRLVVTNSGEQRGTIDLKRRGILPLVDAVRVYSLDKGIVPTNTFERIRALRDAGVFGTSEAADLEHALETLMLLRIRGQLSQLSAGQEPNNHINPKELSTAGRKELKSSLSTIAALQSWVQAHYMTWFIT